MSVHTTAGVEVVGDEDDARIMNGFYEDDVRRRQASYNINRICQQQSKQTKMAARTTVKTNSDDLPPLKMDITEYSDRDEYYTDLISNTTTTMSIGDYNANEEVDENENSARCKLIKRNANCNYQSSHNQLHYNNNNHKTAFSFSSASKNLLFLVVLSVVLLAGAQTSSAFQLDGSQSSFAQFRKWYSGLNGTLELEFKSEQPNGLVMYTDDGGTYDFFELKLVEGVLRLRYNLGGGAQIITVGRDLHDGHWHKVQVNK